jgi:hypothetical protein
VTPSVGAALALGSAYAAVGAAVAIVAAATRTLHLAVGQVLVAGVLVHLVLTSPAVGLPSTPRWRSRCSSVRRCRPRSGHWWSTGCPAGAPVLVGLVVAAGTIDAVVARTVTARPVAAMRS